MDKSYAELLKEAQADLHHKVLTGQTIPDHTYDKLFFLAVKRELEHPGCIDPEERAVLEKTAAKLAEKFPN